MKESVEIREFAGILGSADAHDIPPGAAAYAENLDMVQQRGLFTPLPGDTVIGATAYGKCDKVTPYDDGSVAVLVDRSSSDTSPTLRVVTISNMSNVTNATVTRSEYDTAASDGESVRVGLGATSSAKPKWVGTIFHQQFGAGSTGTQILDAEIKRADEAGIASLTSAVRMFLPDVQVNGTLKTWSNEMVNFRKGFTYIWFASAVYDGIQQAPPVVIGYMHLNSSLGQLYGANAGGTVSITSNSDTGVLLDDAGSASSYTWQEAMRDWNTDDNDLPADGLYKVQFPFRVRITTGGSDQTIPRRVTGYNIFRAEVPGFWSDLPIFDSSLMPAVPDPQFISFIGINDSGWSAAAAGSGAEDFDKSTETYRTFTFTDEYPGNVETFSSKAGYPSTREHMQLHYGVSCISGAYHIVGRCWHPSLQEVESLIFRSKPFKFDTFDWVDDVLALPSEVNALVSYGQRVLAFASARTFVINPASLDIEEEWEGIGCPARKSAVVTDMGVFWADNSNIYWFDGARVEKIGGQVLRNQYSTEASWLDRNTSYVPVLAYDARYDSVIVGYTTAGGNAGALKFHVATQRWTYVTFSAAGPFYCGMQSPSGYAYMSLDNTATPTWYSLFTNATKRSWSWVSAQFLTTAARAYYYYIRLATKSGKPSTVQFFDNDPTYGTGHTVSTWVSNEGTVESGELTTSSKAWIACREFAVRIAGTNAQDVTSIDIIRRFIGPVR